MKTLLFLGMTALSIGTAQAALTNVALNSSVTLQGNHFGNAGGWGGSVLAPAASITDGILLPNGRQWNTGTVFWAGPPRQDSITIALRGSSLVQSILLQADSNDLYTIRYRDTSNTWHNLTTLDLPTRWGLNTRSYTLNRAIHATAFSILAAGGDNHFSVSEFQAWGITSAVPEPETYALVGMGLVALTLRLRNRKTHR
ncbi:PEP-CTERM sorting domain-containing protein [Paludibacterium paludis]|uniref:Ice-binding protein C-terminal domain-containing protein n=1 Tax=Paludibacterium paludis TaxID=1225769 RepID=A0A918P386_9NEIS|nr:PEP-CTERM sorting domain-containing protein [Paludibacterium paludis]GGY16490.1 hypothetical protein GCM10011289_19720 [Paludibacterium paludis]